MSKFGIGNPGGPGRPKGTLSGRRKALAALDGVLSKGKNLSCLKKALQEEFDGDPVKFFRGYVIPLLPKELLSEFEQGGDLEINVRLIDDKGRECSFDQWKEIKTVESEGRSQ